MDRSRHRARASPMQQPPARRTKRAVAAAAAVESAPATAKFPAAMADTVATLCARRWPNPTGRVWPDISWAGAAALAAMADTTARRELTARMATDTAVAVAVAVAGRTRS